jgi:hypothetical protein
MNINHGLVLITLIFSFSNCIYLSEEEFKEIEFMTPTKFSIDHENFAYFKYRLGKYTETVGLKFLEANSYTVDVTTYSSYEKQENKIQYLLADEQFKEINVTGYGDYLYIVIEITRSNYSYDDYLTIYDSAKSIDLENNKVISINKFLSNKEYIFTYKPNTSKTIALFYNAQNFINNSRILFIRHKEGTLTPIGIVDTYKETFNIMEHNSFVVVVDNEYNKTDENANQKQDFTLMIREIENNNFNEILLNKRETINYIYNNESQIFYFYANITDIKELNTLNFKFDYRYYKNSNTKVSVLAKYVPLDEDIDKKDLIKYIPTKNELIGSYDLYSDEYYRIYLNNNNQTSNYLFVIVSVEIKNESYYYGSKSIEFSMGEPEEIIDFTNIPYNQAQKIEKQTSYYIPYYWKLKLDKNDVYLLGIYNEHMFVSTFINGDLITVNNTVNINVSESNNEIIVLKEMDEFTIKLFGIKKNIEVYIERVKKKEIVTVDNVREKNRIFKLDMKEGETKYILGTYSYDDYAFGALTEKYYATIDSGNFEVLFSNNISDDENHLFPSNKKYIQNFNKIIDLKTHLDLFTINCKSDGILYIRPQYKKFDYNVRNIKEGEKTNITMSELIEMAQLSAPLGKTRETLYFTVKIINPQKSLLANNNINDDEVAVTISPESKGAFENQTIKVNQIFKGSYNLSKYRLDELAIYLNSTAFATELEFFEVIRDKYITFKELNNGTNEKLEFYKCFYVIPNNTENLTITIENLNGTNISYGIIKSDINDVNYNIAADNYKNVTEKEIVDNITEFSLNNTYKDNNDTSNPYIIFILRVSKNLDELNYNLNITLNKKQQPQPQPEPQPKPDPEPTQAPSQDKSSNTTKIIIIVVIIVVVILIVVGIILFNVISKRRRRSSTLIEKLGSIDSSENQLG